MAPLVARRPLTIMLVAGFGFLAGLFGSSIGDISVHDNFLFWRLGTPEQSHHEPATTEEFVASDVFIIDITQPDTRFRETVDRKTLAKLIRHISRFSPRIVAMDLMLSADRSDTGNVDLADAIEENGHVILGAWHDIQTNQERLPLFVEQAMDVGILHFVLGDDRTLRSFQPYILDSGVRAHESLSFLSILRYYHPNQEPHYQVSSNGIHYRDAMDNSNWLPVDEDGMTPIYYEGLAGTIPWMSWAAFLRLDPAAVADQRAISNKVFFLGNRHTDIVDAYPAPFITGRMERISGLEIHAQNFASIKHQRVWRVASPLETRWALIATTILTTILVLSVAESTSLLVLLAAACVIFVSSFWMFMAQGYYLGPVGMIFSMAGCWVVGTARRNQELKDLKASIEGLMEAYCMDDIQTVGGEGSSPSTGDVPAALSTRLLQAREILAPTGFEIVGMVGGGGMSVVLKARETRTGRLVAMKLLSPDLVRDPESRARFEREARFAQGMDHVHIVGVVMCGHRMGIPYIGYEYVEGDSLRDHLRNHKRLPYGSAVAIVIQILKGLQVAHSKGIMHRDIKPENVMMTPEGVVKVLDFGIARAEGPEEAFKTRAGIVLGTPSYMAPELVRGKKPSPASDIYAVGITLFELIGGQPPFSRESVSVILVSHLEKKVPSLTTFDLPMPIPLELEQIVMGMLVKDPAKRFQSVESLLNRLEPFATDCLEVFSDQELARMDATRAQRDGSRESTAPLGRTTSVRSQEGGTRSETIQTSSDRIGVVDTPSNGVSSVTQSESQLDDKWGSRDDTPAGVHARTRADTPPGLSALLSISETKSDMPSEPTQGDRSRSITVANKLSSEVQASVARSEEAMAGTETRSEEAMRPKSDRSGWDTQSDVVALPEFTLARKQPVQAVSELNEDSGDQENGVEKSADAE